MKTCPMCGKRMRAIPEKAPNPKWWMARRELTPADIQLVARLNDEWGQPLSDADLIEAINAIDPSGTPTFTALTHRHMETFMMMLLEARRLTRDEHHMTAKQRRAAYGISAYADDRAIWKVHRRCDWLLSQKRAAEASVS